MTITRVQQVTGVLSGTSDTISLPSAPQYGNTLIAVLGRAGSAPIATSLTQTAVTWVSGASGDNAGAVGHHIFYVQKVGPGAGTTITVTRGDTDDYVIAVFEYAGLRNDGGALLDVTATASEDGNSPYTGQTATPTNQDIELFLSAVAHIDTRTRQESPSNQFVELEQVAEAAADASAVMLGVYEKTVAAIDQPNMATHTDEWVVWNSRLQTFFGSLATTTEVELPLNAYVADQFDLSVPLEMQVAATYSPTGLLSVTVGPARYAGLQVSLDAEGLRAECDVSITDARHAQLDVIIAGQAVLAALDVLADPQQGILAGLDVNVGLGTFSRLSFLTCILSAEDIRKTADLDVSVLVPAVPTSVTTTPEDYRYLTCRALWCNVPKAKQVWSRYDVNVGYQYLKTAELNMHIEQGFVRTATLQVFIAPEP